MSGLDSLDVLRSGSFMICYMQQQSDLAEASLEVQVLQARLDVLAKSTTKAKRRIEQIQILNKRLYNLLNSIREEKKTLLLKYCPDSLEPEEEPAEYGLMLNGVDDPSRESNQSNFVYSDEDGNGIAPSTSLNSMQKSLHSMTLHDSFEFGNLSKHFSLTKEDIARISKDFDEAHTAKLEKAFERLMMIKIGVGEVQDLDKGAPGTPTTNAHNHSNTKPVVSAASSTAPSTKKKNRNRKSNLSSNFDVNDVD